MRHRAIVAFLASAACAFHHPTPHTAPHPTAAPPPVSVPVPVFGSDPDADPFPVLAAAPVVADAGPVSDADPKLTQTPHRGPGPRPLLTLQHSATLFLLIADRGRATCERWTVDASDLTRPWLGHVDPASHTHTRVDLDLTSERLIITDVEREHGDRTDSTGCNLFAEAHETDDALVVGGARWFHTLSACQRARAAHDRVATALGFGCALPVEVGDAARAATRRRFERVLARGGELFAVVDRGVPDCIKIQVAPDHARAGDTLAGELRSAVVGDDGRRGTIAYSYELPRGGDRMTVLGPSTSWDDGSGMGFGCGDETSVDLDLDSVTVGQQLFFTESRCRSEIATARAQASWLPPPSATDDEPQDSAFAGAASLAFGGC